MKERKREDENMGWLLQYENVAWFNKEKNIVQILDRRHFPQKKEYINCSSVEEIAQAIKGMVTQSGGQFAAGAMGMVLASNQFSCLPKAEYIDKMKYAFNILTNARPTTKEAMSEFTTPQFNLFSELIEKDISSLELVEMLIENAIQLNNKRYKLNAKAGEYFAKIVKNGDSILTHCFGETCFAGFLRSFNEDNKKVHVYCQETRPFLQGAKLTASLASNLGFETTLITDAMAASVMSSRHINYFVSASDVITQDGYVINKVGTLNTAIVASYFSVPYYAIGMISAKHKSIKNVLIEMRNGDEVLLFNGKKITEDAVSGFYPSFDITPPSLVAGIFTENGLFSIR